MLKNKKGAALLQVLLVTVVLAGMATMLLRASLSRTTTARQTRRTVSGQMLVNSCMVEVNALWSAKTPQAFAEDMRDCVMYRKTAADAPTSHTCNPITFEDVTYTVKATMCNDEDCAGQNAEGQCRLNYEITAKNRSGAEVDVEF